MLHRGATSDQQQEEHAIFHEAANTMDSAFMNQEERRGGNSDTMAKMLHRNRNAHMNQFLSGSAKRAFIDQRRADKEVQKQYYSYQFS